MARASTDELKGILGATTVSEEDLQQQLEEAFAFVEGHIGSVGLSEDRLRLIELRIARGMLTVRDPDATGLLRRERKGDQEREYAVGRGLAELTKTKDWEIAEGLDTSGRLRRIAIPAGGTPWAGGLRVGQKETAAEDTDRPSRRFTRDLFVRTT